MRAKLLTLFTTILFASTLLLSSIFPVNNVYAQTNAVTTNPTLTDIIQCGLEAGSNGDFTNNCTTQTRSPNLANMVAPNPPINNMAITPPASAANGTYAALGDSVAAGLGLLAASNATNQDLQCGRTTQAYPYIVAQTLGVQLIDVACSGATAGDLVTQQGVSGPNITPQLDIAFAAGTPQLITITAGANDVHWDDFLRYCYASNCGSATNTAILNTYLSALSLKMNYALNSIQQRSGGSPPLTIVTGYYNPISSRCANLQQQVTPDEIKWLVSARSALANTIKDATDNFSFAQYVTISFAGHDICSPDPWVQSLSSSAPFHPTAQGQQTIANTVVSAVGR